MLLLKEKRINKKKKKRENPNFTAAQTDGSPISIPTIEFRFPRKQTTSIAIVERRASPFPCKPCEFLSPRQ